VINPELIIFDLDGTLVDFPKEYLFLETQRILPLIGYNLLSADEMEEGFSNFNFFGFANNAQDVIDVFWKKFNWEDFPKSKPFSFTLDILEELKKKDIKLAIATARTSSHQELELDLKQSDLLDFFEITQPRETEEQDWEDKIPQIDKVLEFTNVSKENAILVGDIPADARSGNNAGLLASVAVLSGGIKHEVLKASNPNYILNDIRELPQLIKE